MSQCLRFYVSGRVQGVSYRAWAQRQAQTLGLTGYAKNLPDGRVEVLVCGSDDTVAEFKQALWQGPRLAKVENIEEKTVTTDGEHASFSIG